MHYTSTRDNRIQVMSHNAILEGLSKDGGLFVPDKLISVSFNEIQALMGLSYQERAFQILHKYFPDYTHEELTSCIRSAYARPSFAHPKVTPIQSLSENLYILELWHGPTGAFKDIALQILPHLLVAAKRKNKSTHQTLILVATSGDTGKAALEGFKDIPGIRVMVYYPQKGISKIQEHQMLSQEGGNVSVVGIDGNFDHAQKEVKRMFSDALFNEALMQKGTILSSANSINWGRLAPQIVYYFSAYADLLEKGVLQNGEKINFVVPTGNFGNILAGYYAKKMGLPIQKLICASNQNNILTDFFQTGTYNQNRPFYVTTSPSMDILRSSNVERLLYHLNQSNTPLVSQWMKGLETQNVYHIDEKTFEHLKRDFYANFATQIQTQSTIAKTHQLYHYLLDPHTAVAMHVLNTYREEYGDSTKSVILSTASPYKFPSSVFASLYPQDLTSFQNEFSTLDELHKRTQFPIPPCLAHLKDKPPLHNQPPCAISNMSDIVFRSLS